MAVDPQIREEILGHVTACLAFYGKTVDDKTLDTWARVLAGRATPDQVASALDQHMAESRLSPKPSDVLKRVPKREKRREPVAVDPAPVQRPPQSWVRSFVSNLFKTSEETP